MRIFLSLIACIFLIGCAENLRNYVPSPKSRSVDQVGCKVSKQLKSHGLCLVDCGGRMMNEITLLHLGFCCYREVTVSEARQLLLLAGNTFLQAINNDEKIRPYLKTHPFTPNNIEIRIFFKNPNGSEIGYDKLHVASLLEGLMDYDTIIEPLPNRLTTLCQETFEEAVSQLYTANEGER